MSIFCLCNQYCHVFWRLRCRFGLVIGFINNLQVVTTITKLLLIYTIYNHSSLISSVYLC
jgi:hypothetical protein